LVARLEARGAKLDAWGDQLRVVAPQGAVTESDLAELRRWKPEVLGRLKALAAERRDRFLANGSIPVAIFHSQRLGRDFVLARDAIALEALTERDQLLPVLTFADCEKLAGLEAADLSAILDVRQALGPNAELVAVRSRLG
jgi:hypothetical protein